MKNKIFHTQDLCLRTNGLEMESKMKFSWRMIAAAFSYALGVLGWCYVGGYKILTGPVRELILAQMAGSMSLGRLVAALIEGFIYLSLAGGVWCIGYMLSSHFRED